MSCLRLNRVGSFSLKLARSLTTLSSRSFSSCLRRSAPVLVARPSISLLNSSRSISSSSVNMAETKLYIGGLPWATTAEDLRQKFSEYGNVTDAVVITDRMTGRSRGFGFVSYGSMDEAQTAINEMDGKDFGGRFLKVNIAQQRPEGEGFRGGRGGGFGGGYGGNRGGFGRGGGYGQGGQGGWGGNQGGYGRGDGGYGGNY